MTMPGRADVFQKAMNEGHSAAWDQDWGKAAAAYRKALQEIPDQPKALNSLGLALYQLNELEEALRTYQHVARLSPDDPAPFEKAAQISERLGDLKGAVDSSAQAAEKFFNQREVDKAIENWTRVTTLQPDDLAAHSRLAMVHERLGHAQQAVTEYLALASIFQRSGKPDKAQELITKSLQLLPQSQEAKQAQTLLKSGQLLPKPIRPRGATGPITMAKLKTVGDNSSRATSRLWSGPGGRGASKSLDQAGRDALRLFRRKSVGAGTTRPFHDHERNGTTFTSTSRANQSRFAFGPGH